MNWLLLMNSLLVAGVTALAAGLFGFLAALWVAGLEGRWRRRLLLLAVVAVVLPPFLVTNCWLDLLGLNGAWRPWLPFSIYSLGGTAWVLALLTWPISMLAALSAWQRLQPSQLDSEPLLRGWTLIRWVLWPMARRAVALAAVVLFVLALNNFTVPAILQVKVFPAEVWLRFSTNFDTAGALTSSWPLIAVPLLLLLLLCRTEIQWPRTEDEATARALRRQLGAAWRWGSGMTTGLLLALALGLPLVELASTARTWLELPGALRAASGTAWNSFWFAAATATICTGLGMVTWRWRFGLVLWLPFLVPGVLLGVGLIWVFNRPALDAIYTTSAIVIVAFVARYLALGCYSVAHAFRGIDRDLTDAARVEGASRLQLLRWVRLPLAASPVAAAWYVTYLLCLWDVETLVLIVPPGGETLALRVFNLLHYGHTAQVNALCVVLLVLAAAPLVLWNIAQWIRSNFFGAARSCPGAASLSSEA
jgi:iron(III) transport system permease protein